MSKPLPIWAEKKSDGQYMKIGTQLCTRDGRKVGNAYVSSLHEVEKLGLVANIITDAGTKLSMTEEELVGMFHEPMFIMKVNDMHKRFSTEQEIELLEKCLHCDNLVLDYFEQTTLNFKHFIECDKCGACVQFDVDKSCIFDQQRRIIIRK